MSFGFSVSDITNLIQLATHTYQGWKRACGEYADITRELQSLQIILSRVAFEVEAPTALLLHHDHDLRQLQDIATNCKQVVAQLNEIISKYNGIVISRRNNWNKIRFGQENLEEIRGKLTITLTALSTYLDVLGVSAIGRMDQKLDGLAEMRKVIDGLAVEIRAGKREGSIMTTYENDEKEVWRQFRRELISEGFSSENLKKMKSHLQIYMKRMAEANLLDEEQPPNPKVSNGQSEGLTDNGQQVKSPAEPSGDVEEDTKSFQDGAPSPSKELISHIKFSKLIWNWVPVKGWTPYNDQVAESLELLVQTCHKSSLRDLSSRHGHAFYFLLLRTTIWCLESRAKRFKPRQYSVEFYWGWSGVQMLAHLAVDKVVELEYLIRPSMLHKEDGRVRFCDEALSMEQRLKIEQVDKELQLLDVALRTETRALDEWKPR